ncbi:MAG: ATP-binding protein [Acidobacteriota bacterium]
MPEASFASGHSINPINPPRAEDMLKTSPAGIGFYAVDDHGNLIDADPVFCSLLGYSRAELYGKPIDDIKLAGPPRDGTERERVLETDVWNGCRQAYRRKDGGTIYLQVRPRLLQLRRRWIFIFLISSPGQVSGLQKDLIRSQKLEAVGMLVDGVAHDFNNLLTGIMGFTELLLQDVDGESNAHQALLHIRLLSERAAQMAKQLLAFSHPETEQGVIRLSLHSFLQETRKFLERVIPETIEISLNLADEDLQVEVDPTQLLQVVLNLAINARDAMAEGGTLSIDTAEAWVGEGSPAAPPALMPGHYARLSLRDSGPGIPPDIRSRIFDPFFTTKARGEGTGLGLTIARQLVECRGGAVDISSRVGLGTTVHVYLPLMKPEALDQTAAESEVAWGNETILVAEDNQDVRKMTRLALETLGYRVLEASNGLDALDLYREYTSEISLVLADMVMPRLGGIETLRELRRLNPNVKVLITTGYDAGSRQLKELRAPGICGLLQKPYRIEVLARAVRDLLDQNPTGSQDTAPEDSS